MQLYLQSCSLRFLQLSSSLNDLRPQNNQIILTFFQLFYSFIFHSIVFFFFQIQIQLVNCVRNRPHFCISFQSIYNRKKLRGRFCHLQHMASISGYEAFTFCHHFQPMGRGKEKEKKDKTTSLRKYDPEVAHFTSAYIPFLKLSPMVTSCQGRGWEKQSEQPYIIQTAWGYED